MQVNLFASDEMNSLNIFCVNIENRGERLGTYLKAFNVSLLSLDFTAEQNVRQLFKRTS